MSTWSIWSALQKPKLGTAAIHFRMFGVRYEIESNGQKPGLAVARGAFAAQDCEENFLYQCVKAVGKWSVRSDASLDVDPDLDCRWHRRRIGCGERNHAERSSHRSGAQNPSATARSGEQPAMPTKQKTGEPSRSLEPRIASPQPHRRRRAYCRRSCRRIPSHRIERRAAATLRRSTFRRTSCDRSPRPPCRHWRAAGRRRSWRNPSRPSRRTPSGCAAPTGRCPSSSARPG